MSKQLEEGPKGLLTYRNAVLVITVQGGVKLEGLDRLVVTLKVEVTEGHRPAIRHRVELYNDNQTSKFARTVAGKLEVGLTVVEASLSEITDLLEAWRLEEIGKQGDGHASLAMTPLTAEEETQARADLKRPGLLGWTGERLGESGIVGEERNRLVLFLVMVSRLLRDPLSAVCMARSGVGKSHLMERVAQCMPEPAKLECTTLTPEALYYMGRYELQHRILLIEDLEGAKGVLYPIRELQTRKRLSKTFTEKDRNGKSHTVQRIVEGPVSVVACTTAETIYEDNANRSLPLHLDDSAEQDARIMAHQRALVAGLIDAGQQQAVRERLQRMQRVLKPIKVVNPYAPLIALPAEVFKPRRTLQLLLSFIEAVTFYHQQQRGLPAEGMEEKADPATGEVFIETSPEDVETAFDLLSDTLFRKADELSGASRSLLEWIRSNCGSEAFTAQAVRARLRMAPRTLSRYLGELTAYGHLVQDKKKKHSAGYSYTVASTGTEDLPEAIARQVAQVIERVRACAEQGRSEAAGTKVEAPAENVTEAAPVAKRKPGRPRKVRVDEGKRVGQSATVGQEIIGRPTEVDPSVLGQVGQSATEKEQRR